MTPREVARLFRVELATILRYGSQGLIERVILPSRGSGKRKVYRYKRASVEWWMSTMQKCNGKHRE
jgi:hypothetical protein